MNNYKLYVHIAPNGKRYYGITKQRPKQRWQNGKGYRNNPYFARAINKYGWNNIKHEVLADGLTEHEAQELEQYMIQWYDTANRKHGYNLSTGGESSSGYKHTEEAKQKMSEARKGRSHPMCGKHHTEETKKKLSEANKLNARSVICLTTNKIFLSTREGARYYNICNAHISSCCKGDRKSAGKYNGQKLLWKYVNHRHNRVYRVVETFDIDSWNLFDDVDNESLDYDNLPDII